MAEAAIEIGPSAVKDSATVEIPESVLSRTWESFDKLSETLNSIDARTEERAKDQRDWATDITEALRDNAEANRGTAAALERHETGANERHAAVIAEVKGGASFKGIPLHFVMQALVFAGMIVLTVLAMNGTIRIGDIEVSGHQPHTDGSTGATQPAVTTPPAPASSPVPQSSLEQRLRQLERALTTQGPPMVPSGMRGSADRAPTPTQRDYIRAMTGDE